MADTWREIEAEWQGGNGFIGTNAKGASVQMGMVNEMPGVSPMEIVLIGLAGCTGLDIVDILAKKREKLKSLKVKVRGNRATDYPMVYKEIEVTYLLWGEGINPLAVERAIELSEKKYCSVSNMLCSVAKITSSYQIFDAQTLP
jgi:putative redox protein